MWVAIAVGVKSGYGDITAFPTQQAFAPDASLHSADASLHSAVLIVRQLLKKYKTYTLRTTDETYITPE